jgi:hypothetical protein
MAVWCDFLWLQAFGAFARRFAMANEPTFVGKLDSEEAWFPLRRSPISRRSSPGPGFERRLAEHGMLRRRALALIVIGLGFVAMAGVNLDLFDATVGLISVAAGGVWRLCLS